MKTTNFLKQLPGLLLVSGALIFTSCENNNRTDRGTATERDGIGTTDERAVDTYDMTEEDYNTRRNRVAANLDNEINRSRTEVEELRERANMATGEERNELQQRIERLETRIENLEDQQEQMENSTMDNWEETERDIENNLQDRDGTRQNIERRDNEIERERSDFETGSDLETGSGVRSGTTTETQTDAAGRDTERDHNRIDSPETTTDENRNETTGERGTGNVD
jgi:TolA-binding protein